MKGITEKSANISIATPENARKVLPPLGRQRFRPQIARTAHPADSPAETEVGPILEAKAWIECGIPPNIPL